MPLAEPPVRPRENFPLFDSWRGLAALMVLFVHGVYQFAVTFAPGDHRWYDFALHLDVAVPIFFGISGFLLYRPFVLARVRGKHFSVRQYALRRALRIIPAYWVALVVIVHWFDFDEVKSVEGWLTYGGFLQLYKSESILHGLGQAWTLNIEVVFYAFLPLWVLIVNWFMNRAKTPRFQTEALGILGLIAFAYAWQAATLYFVDVGNLDESRSLIRLPPLQLDHLGAGMLLAVLTIWVAERRNAGEQPPAPRLVSLVENRPAIVMGLGAAIWLVVATFGRSGGKTAYANTDPQFFTEHILYTPVVFLLLAPAAFGGERRDLVRRLIGSRPLRYVGMISYSFYLWHYAIVGQEFLWWGRIPENLFEWVVWLGAATAATLVVATISYRLIEKPFMDIRYGRSKTPGREPEAAPQAAP